MRLESVLGEKDKLFQGHNGAEGNTDDGTYTNVLWWCNIDAIYMAFQIILWYYQDKCPNYDVTIVYIYTFIFMHLADAFIQSDLQVIIFFLSVPVFPGN